VTGPAARATAGLRQLLGASQATAVAARGTMAATRRDMAMVRQGADRMTTAISLPLALIGAMGAKTAYEFAKAGNNMQAVTRITTEQRKEIEKLAQELNEKFPSTVVDIMGAAFELGRAGLDFDQIMGGLEGTLQLGLAGDLALAEAADISTNILTAMRLPAKGADQVAASLQRVNDVLSYVATSSNTDVRLMGETLKYVAPMAAAAGMPLAQVGRKHAPTFVADTAAKTGQSERKVCRDATRATKIERIADVVGTSLNEGGKAKRTLIQFRNST